MKTKDYILVLIATCILLAEFAPAQETVPADVRQMVEKQPTRGQMSPATVFGPKAPAPKSATPTPPDGENSEIIQQRLDRALASYEQLLSQEHKLIRRWHEGVEERLQRLEEYLKKLPPQLPASQDQKPPIPTAGSLTPPTSKAPQTSGSWSGGAVLPKGSEGENGATRRPESPQTPEAPADAAPPRPRPWRRWRMWSAPLSTAAFWLHEVADWLKALADTSLAAPE